MNNTEFDLATIDPDSPEFAAMLDKAMGAEEELQDEQVETSATAGAARSMGNEDKATGILAADGKHIIPIDVLRSARAAEAQAREAAAAAIAELEALKAAAAKSEAGDEIEVDVEQSDELDAQLATLAEDYPELGGFAKNLAAQVKAMRDVVSQLAADREANATQERVQRQLSVREAIDSNPTLLTWEQSDPEAWSRAVAYDKLLRERPDWQGKPIQERFEQVAKLVQVDYPSAKKPVGTAPKTDNGIASKAREALAAASDLEIESLTQIPGGTPPNDQELAGLSVTQLEAMFERNPDKIDALLMRYA